MTEQESVSVLFYCVPAAEGEVSKVVCSASLFDLERLHQHIQRSLRLVNSQLSRHFRSFYLFKNSIQAPRLHRICKISSDLLPDFLHNSDPGHLCSSLRGTTLFPREQALHPLHINLAQPLHARFSPRCDSDYTVVTSVSKRLLSLLSKLFSPNHRRSRWFLCRGLQVAVACM